MREQFPAGAWVTIVTHGGCFTGFFRHFSGFASSNSSRHTGKSVTFPRFPPPLPVSLSRASMKFRLLSAVLILTASSHALEPLKEQARPLARGETNAGTLVPDVKVTSLDGRGATLRSLAAR